MTAPGKRRSERSANVRGIELVAFGDIHLRKGPRDLVRGLLPRDGLILLWGPPKSGKSFWALDVAMHVAIGRPYRGRAVQAGTVVYCAFEGQNGLSARLEAMRKHVLTPEDAPAFYLMPDSLDLVTEGPALIAAVEALPQRPVLVVLDTLNRSLVGSESSDQDMAAYVRAADGIRAAFGCAVLIVHHCGHEGGRPRGHSSLTGSADAQLSIKRSSNGLLRVTVELAKDAPQGDRTTSRLEEVAVGNDSEGYPIRSCILLAAADDPTSSNVKGQAAFALQQLQKALATAGTEQDLGGRAGRVVSLSVWRSYCSAGMSRGDNPGSIRKAFDRALRTLQVAGVVGVSGQFAWLIEHRETNGTT